jgi:hypothetical protein
MKNQNPNPVVRWPFNFLSSATKSDTSMSDAPADQAQASPAPENSAPLEPDADGSGTKSRTLTARFSEKPRADRNREKAELLNIDYDALHQESLAKAEEIYAKLVEDRAPLLRANAVLCSTENA